MKLDVCMLSLNTQRDKINQSLCAIVQFLPDLFGQLKFQRREFHMLKWLMCEHDSSGSVPAYRALVYFHRISWLSGNISCNTMNHQGAAVIRKNKLSCSRSGATFCDSSQPSAVWLQNQKMWMKLHHTHSVAPSPSLDVRSPEPRRHLWGNVTGLLSSTSEGQSAEFWGYQ